MNPFVQITTFDGLSHILETRENGAPDIEGYSTSINTREVLETAFLNGHWEPYTPPEPVLPTLAEVKSQVKAQVKFRANTIRAAITENVSPAEAGAWSNKEAEALVVQAGGTEADAPMLAAEAAARQITLAEVAGRVLANAQAWRGLEGQIAGACGWHREQVDALETVEAVLSYDYSGGWPGGGGA